MGDNLMDFSAFEGNENDENFDPEVELVPELMQTPVVRHSILKQSTKDNLIQLVTPVTKNKKLKVHFTPSVQTPSLRTSVPDENTSGQETKELSTAEEEERENWAERTSVLTKQDHQDYCQYAEEFLLEIIANLPVKEEESSTDSGFDVSMMDTMDTTDQPPTEGEKEIADDVLSEAENLLRMLREQTGSTSFAVEDFGYEDEPMDIDVSVVQIQEQSVTPQENITADKNDKRNSQEAVETPAIENEVTVDSPKHEKVTAELEMPTNTISDIVQNADSTNVCSKGEDEIKTGLDTKTDIEIHSDTQKKVTEVFDDITVGKSTKTNVAENNLDKKIPETENVSGKLHNTEAGEMERDEKINHSEAAFVNKLSTKDEDQSSDEEFLSADEETVSQDKTPNVVESPMRTPPKVGYNLNFDDLESVNPFQTKTCVQNSPDINAKSKPGGKTVDKSKPSIKIEVSKGKGSKDEVSKEKVENPKMLSAFDPDEINKEENVQDNQDKNINNKLEDKTQTQNQTIITANKVQANEVPEKSGTLNQEKEEPEGSVHSPPLPKRGAYNLDDLDSMDPFKPKKQMCNSPVVSQKEARQTDAEVDDPVKPEMLIINSQTDKAVTSEIETTAGDNSCVNEVRENTSEPSKPNQSNIKKEKPQVQKEENAYSLPDSLDDIDPFKSGDKMMNSPVAKPGSYEALPEDLDAFDPFKPKKQMMNSPVAQEKRDNKNAEKSDMKTDELLEDIDPFKPSKQIMNSPGPSGLPENLDEIDPFKPKKQIINSPDKVIQNVDFPENSDDIDPFKPSKQIKNSPGFESNNDNNNRFETDDAADPFKNSSKVMNSPASASIKESLTDSLDNQVKPKNRPDNSPYKVLAELDLPENLDDIDPFKPRKQMMNSPLGSIDKVNNSPDLVIDLPDSLEELDPFKPRNQMKNSPVSKDSKDFNSEKIGANVKDENEKDNTFSDTDPFKPKGEIQNSPQKAEEDSLKNVDPFKPRKQMLNSPVGKRLKPGSGFEGTPKSVLSPFLNRNRGLPSTPEETTNEDGDVMEVQGVTRRGATNPQGFDIDESEFVAASEVFKDPGVWEMLEKFGSSAANPSQESALSRMSLYVKFDPLVEKSSRLSTNPRRVSIRPKQLEKVKEYGLDETLLLLGTPPKKRRQSTVVTQQRHTPVTALRAPAEEGQKPRELNMGQGAVDLIMALSPENDGMMTNGNHSQPTSLLPGLVDENSGGLFEELKYTESDLRQQQQQLQTELQLEFQGQLIVKEKEWYKKEQQHEQQLKQALAALEAEKKTTNEMRKACDMFEDIIKKLDAKQEKSEKHIADLMKEKEQMAEDLKGVENSFAEQHRRYEKLRTVVEGNLKNEETLKKYASDLAEKLKKSEEQYTTLKKTAEEKIAKSSQEIAKLKDVIALDTDKHEASKKAMSLKIEILEKQIQQKTEENKNLTEICDQLIQKVN